MEEQAAQKVLQPQGGGISEEFPEGGTVEGSREAKGDRGGLGGGATVKGLEAWRLGKLQKEGQRCDRAEEHQWERGRRRCRRVSQSKESL